MFTIRHALQGLHYFSSSIKQKIQGPTIYDGSAIDICKKIVNACWNGSFFQTSTHHYNEFWARDFGYSVSSLLKLGYKDQVLSSLSFALKYYSQGIKTTITKSGKSFSFPNVYSPDSTALFFHALEIAKADLLLSHHNKFLQNELDKFAKTVLTDKCEVKPLHFSGMRDYAKRQSSCYDHCMAILTARTAKKLNLAFPFSEKELVKNLANYWTGSYYKDTLNDNVLSADANVLPLWLGINKHVNRILKSVQTAKLDLPIPIAYLYIKQPTIAPRFFVPDWQYSAKWPFLGFLWMQVLKEYKPAIAMKHKETYSALIEKHGTLFELYKNKNPYKSLFYHADEGMLWAANFAIL